MTNEILFKLGIPTLFTQIQILLTGSAQQNLNQTMQKSVGRIYGISTYTNTVTPLNQPLITNANATNLYLTFVKGTNQFAQSLRLDELNFTTPAAELLSLPGTNSRYLSINLPGVDGIDFDKSFLNNPTGITSATVVLNLWYIDLETYNYMERNKMVLRNAKAI